MRFSLLTLLLLAFWLATAGLVLHRWHPWERTVFPNGETQLIEAEFQKQYPAWPQKYSYKSQKSPDGTRSLNWAHGGFAVSILSDEEGNSLCLLPVHLGFVDDNRIVGVDGNFSAEGEFSYGYYFLMQRRHPEWWWGHFYRPEVWALIALTIVLGWRILKVVRTRPSK